MLTATYSFIAISIEQKNAYKRLSKLQDDIQNVSWDYQRYFDVAPVDSIMRKLLDFNKYCRNRKIETLMIPAMRKTSGELQMFLSELDALSIDVLKRIHFLYRQTQLADNTDEFGAEEILALMEQYCQNYFKRLEKEEMELFPIARRLLSNDDWFCIAVECMSDGSRNAEMSDTDADTDTDTDIDVAEYQVGVPAAHVSLH